MKNFLKISLVMLALLVCTQSWAGDDLKGKDKPADKPQNTDAKTEIEARAGKFEGMVEIGGFYGIKCSGTEGICFIIMNGSTLYIEDTNQTFEISGEHGSSTQGNTTTYFYSFVE